MGYLISLLLILSNYSHANEAVCNSMRTPDTKNHCLAIVKNQESFCQGIQDADSRNLCFAQVKRQANYCRNIANTDAKIFCIEMVKWLPSIHQNVNYIWQQHVPWFDTHIPTEQSWMKNPMVLSLRIFLVRQKKVWWSIWPKSILNERIYLWQRLFSFDSRRPDTEETFSNNDCLSATHTFLW